MRRIVLALLLVAGCASQPTASDLIGASYAAIEAAANTSADLCAAPSPGADCTGSMPTDVRDAIRTALLDASDLLDDARSLSVIGSDEQAMDAIQAARQILARVEARLNES